MLIATKTGMGGPPYALRPEKVAAALDASLERLRTDYVDLYYAHRDDRTTPLDEVVAGYDAAVKSGKARELGASNYTAERLAEITALADKMGATPYYRAPAQVSTWSGATNTKARCRTSALRRGSRGPALLRPRLGFPLGQVPQARRLGGFTAAPCAQ